jgi:hypothetical protein
MIAIKSSNGEAIHARSGKRKMTDILHTEKISWQTLRDHLRYNQRTGWLTWNTSKPRIRKGQRAGYQHSKGHRRIEVNGKDYSEHRLIWFWMTKHWPPEYVDHKNRIPNDNRWHNLRLATHGQNYINSKTFGPMRGIMKRGGSYRVRSIVKGKRISHTVRNLSAAKKLRRRLEIQEWGEFTCTRR